MSPCAYAIAHFCVFPRWILHRHIVGYVPLLRSETADAFLVRLERAETRDGMKGKLPPSALARLPVSGLLEGLLEKVLVLYWCCLVDHVSSLSSATCD